MDSRRAKAEIKYVSVTNKKERDISGYVLSMNYTDNSDKTDDISIELEDRANLWEGDWFPESGDLIIAKIKIMDWTKEGDNRELSLGTFEVDQFNKGQTVTLNGVSVPITSNIRSEPKDKAWENINLKSIANDMSKNAGLTLVYESEYIPYYKRKDQSDESDLSFLEGLCKEDGMCVKISDKQLIIFDESTYDKAETNITLKVGTSDIIGNPNFSRSAKNIYKACEIKYHNSDKDTIYRAYFEDDTVTAQSSILRLKESTSETLDETTLKRKAQSRLREQNKKEWKARMTVVGDLIYFTSSNVMIKGNQKFDGKYNIESATYSVGKGFTVDLELRKCLNY